MTKRDAVQHPYVGRGPSILVTIDSTTFLAVLYEGFVSFDHNKNGSIESNERIRMERKGEVYKARVSIRHLVPKTSIPSHVDFISTNLKKNLGIVEDMKRKGVLWDGTHFYLHSVNGVFHHPDSQVVLDVNQDNVSDIHHSLYKTTLNSGSISWNGNDWKPSLSSDGKEIIWTRVGSATLSIGSPIKKIEVHDVRKKKRIIGGDTRKPVVLDFWATWCATCIRDHKKLKALQRKYNISIVGIADNSPQEIRRYVKKRRIRWPQISLQEHSQIRLMFPMDALPRYALIDNKGILLFMGTIKGLEEELGEI